MKIVKYITLVSIFFLLVGCETISETDTFEPQYSPVVEQSSSRTLVLEGDEYTERSSLAFMTWKCRHYFDGGKTLFEVGRIYFPDSFKESDEFLEVDEESKRIVKKFGFILYDGTNIGDLAQYTHAGLNHRWDWGAEISGYSFIIKPDGTGLYYDFNTAKDGVKEKADGLYKCGR